MRILISSFMVLCTITLSYGQYDLTIKVLDDSTDDPLPNATLVLGDIIGASNLNGEFTFTDLPKGFYPLRVSYVGYSGIEKSIRIPDTKQLSIKLESEAFLTDEVVVSSTRASEDTPMTYTSVDKESIESLNLGQDLPFILNFTPSLVTTSDAGAGIGYTGLRIRGSDATRINVTINGIPLNDSESQGVFWVNTPDLASSTNNIQIQRGVGTSTNGAGAFGGTVNIQTNARKSEPYADIVNSFGSFNTRRHTLGFGTGLFNKYWTIDGRLSKIESDGYIDRASSDLQSYYFAGGFYKDKTMVKAIMFGGAERTYQSWYGTPEAVLENDTEGIEAVIINNGLNELQAENIKNSGRTFNWYLYDNQVDDYKQDHYQLHVSQELTPNLVANISAHYTYGRGFFEQYRYEDDFEDYGLEPVALGDTLIESSDIIRRRWLDNDFYGFTYSVNYTNDKFDLTVGGAANRYDGDHFGELIWAQLATNFQIEDRYYDNVGVKDDFNSFVKLNYNLNDRLSAYVDIQYRFIGYETNGTDNDLVEIDVNEEFNFFNPKFGVFYQMSDNHSFYSSFAVANREPVRNDFIDSPTTPKSERLNNLELGYKFVNSKMQIGINGYYMDYQDQLILTGELNDVGASVRTNVENSYRAGIELVGGAQLSRRWNWQANLTLSRNKIEEFNEVLYDYGQNFDEFNIITNNYSDTDIAFSPNVIAGSQLKFTPVNNGEITLLSKYVGEQFLDNTSNPNRKLDAYFVNDLRLSYTVLSNHFKELTFSVLINNVFDELYSSNGYTFGYFAGPGSEIRENYLYPQATRNFLASVTLRL
ncbi:TonB-dependent receptor [Fulvivirga lutea]|uniref:TonB-dependent receptor n=1 Tax=Fulvivirga lutea TaxID=2810512 RepID=A0A974WIF6_9BACT|nr:TonB-dependent receptor [Fulvivirga lutea]QSE97807.1 TonB-dependent receptor [Fulvivirga lutea]